MAPRIASLLAAAVGTVVGGSAAYLGADDAPPRPGRAVEQSPAPPAPLAPPTASVLVPAAEAPSQATSADEPASAPSASAAEGDSPTAGDHGFGDLIPSPHDHPLLNEEALRKAERLCIADLPYQCMRVADVYAAGEIVPADNRRHSQYRNLAFRLYIKQCEAHSIEACYSLARMYLRGEGVKANPAYAQNLMRRVLELCGYKKVKLCERLEIEAPEVIERYKAKPTGGTE